MAREVKRWCVSRNTPNGFRVYVESRLSEATARERAAHFNQHPTPGWEDDVKRYPFRAHIDDRR